MENKETLDTQLFNRYAPMIRTLTSAELNGNSSLKSKFLLAREGSIEICYAPVEYINSKARVVIVGITPGFTQMVNFIKEAHRLLNNGSDVQETMSAIKSAGSFSGNMRSDLVAMLDSIGVNRWLAISSCNALFNTHSHLAHMTSILRNPVFVNGDNYKGTPDILRTPILKAQLMSGFFQDASLLPSAIFVPLGDVVVKAFGYLIDQGIVKGSQVLVGLPHPSPANRERIHYFLGKKPRHLLSKKTNADKIDQARETIQRQVNVLP
ncbi:MAG: hypothetical protein KGI54_12735 [Pseudomonadota bacterium]|nr:hypothetical protein [Pseudomonadota bacterium]